MRGETAERSGIGGFLTNALAPVFTRRMVVPIIVLTLILTFSNIVILLNIPERGQLPPPTMVVAAVVRVVGLAVLAVAILRILTDSPRRPWRPDGAFWLYLLTVIAGIALGIAVGALIGIATGLGREDAVAGLIVGILVILISAPLAAWFTAIAVERPLAWKPGRWMRAWRRWLPHLVFWSLLILTPIAFVHAAIDRFLLAGAGDWFWPLALFDGPLSVLIALGTYALVAEAYRRVASG